MNIYKNPDGTYKDQMDVCNDMMQTAEELALYARTADEVPSMSGMKLAMDHAVMELTTQAQLIKTLGDTIDSYKQKIDQAVTSFLNR